MKFALERLADILAEVEELWHAHWKETEGYRHALVFNPDVKAMLEFDRRGLLKLYTVRREGQLIGQIGFILFRSRQTQTKAAAEDFWYVRPEERGKGAASRLMSFALADLRSLGIEEVMVTDKEPTNLGPFLERFGFRQVAKSYSLLMKEV